MALPRVALLATIFFCLTVSAFALHQGNKLTSAGSDKTPVTRAIVKLAATTSLAKQGAGPRLATSDTRLNQLMEQLSVRASSALLRRNDNSNASALFDRTMIVEFDNVDDLRTFVAEAATLSSVEYVEPDYHLELFDVPNDPLLQFQWNLRNTGQQYYAVFRLEGEHNDFMLQQSGTVGADIKAADIPTPPLDNSPIVAVIDTGIDPLHPELADVLWHNEDEIAGNATDDDHNGYVDDTWGWDFSANPNIIPIFDDNDPTDPFGHGTHCAGIIGAQSNNSSGIAGVSRHCRIMGLKIWPTMSVALAARAVLYAVANGADVISMSWGTPYQSLLLKEALEYAYSQGVVLCAATGNSGYNEAFVPAVYDVVIAVTATNSKDQVTWFSTFGDHVDICAPGDNILSLRATGTDMYGEAPSLEPGVHVVNEFYYEASGTSMACPHVAGVAGELKAFSPGLSPEKVKSILFGSADDLVDPLGDGKSYPGKDIYSGHGRLNLQKALEQTPATAAIIENPQNEQVVTNSMEVIGTALAGGSTIYTLDFQKSDDDSWNTIGVGTANRNSTSLGTWDVSQLEGNYTLRLRVGEFNEVRRSVLVVNRGHSEILAPGAGAHVSGGVEFFVNAVSPHFERAELRYQPLPATGEWTLINTTSVPLTPDDPVFWDAAALPDGRYRVNLLVIDQDGLRDSTSIDVNLLSPFSGGHGWRTPLGLETSIVPNYGDFDGDGQTEIVVGTNAGLRFYKLDGAPEISGVPLAPPDNFLVPPVVCDIDDDSIDDLAAVSENPHVLYAFASGEPDYRFEHFREVGTHRYNSSSESLFPVLCAKDLDNDGRDEIVFKTSRSGSGDSYLLIASPGAPAGSSCFPIELGAFTVQTADLNNDSIHEIYTTTHDGKLRRYNLCGTLEDEVVLNPGLLGFYANGMCAVDINSDGVSELVVMGYFGSPEFNTDFYLMAFNRDLRIEDNWIRHINVPSTLAPSMAVFGDIDSDNRLEYILSFHDADYGYVFAWHLDGSPVLLDVSMENLLGATLRPGIAGPPLIVGLDAIDGPEVVSVAGRDLFGTFPRQRVYSWSATGAEPIGWPLYVSPYPLEWQYRSNIPVYGDLNKDGITDMIMVTASQELIFTSIEGSTWNASKSPCPMWRYNRQLNNIVPGVRNVGTAVDDDSPVLPTDILTAQNFPNPFNNATTIEYNLPRPGSLTLEIVNLLGQTIKSYEFERQPRGLHQISWNGTDRKGGPVASGVYFYRVRSDNASTVGKMLLLK